jgi:crossover junction endodeoxyribonuclease RusA
MSLTRPATQLTLPWPPSVNGYWQPYALPHSRRVVMTLTDSAKIFRSRVIIAIRKAFGRVQLSPYTRPVQIDVELRAPDRRLRDVDNHVKGLFDALTHAGVWKDDSLVDVMVVRRGPLIRGGAANVLIASLDGEPTDDEIPEIPNHAHRPALGQLRKPEA